MVANQATSRWTSSPLVIERNIRNQISLKWRVRESHPAVVAYEASMSTRSPASLFCADTKLQVPVSNRKVRPYESQLGTCRTCNVVVVIRETSTASGSPNLITFK